MWFSTDIPLGEKNNCSLAQKKKKRKKKTAWKGRASQQLIQSEGGNNMFHDPGQERERQRERKEGGGEPWGRWKERGKVRKGRERGREAAWVTAIQTESQERDGRARGAGGTRGLESCCWLSKCLLESYKTDARALESETDNFFHVLHSISHWKHCKSPALLPITCQGKTKFTGDDS